MTHDVPAIIRNIQQLKEFAQQEVDDTTHTTLMSRDVASGEVRAYEACLRIIAAHENKPL